MADNVNKFMEELFQSSDAKTAAAVKATESKLSDEMRILFAGKATADNRQFKNLDDGQKKIQATLEDHGEAMKTGFVGTVGKIDEVLENQKKKAYSPPLWGWLIIIAIAALVAVLFYRIIPVTSITNLTAPTGDVIGTASSTTSYKIVLDVLLGGIFGGVPAYLLFCWAMNDAKDKVSSLKEKRKKKKS